LEPKTALNDNKSSIIPLALQFPPIIADEHLDRLCDQWRELASYKSDLEHLSRMEPPAFWLQLKQLTDGNDKPKFDILCELMCTLVALPHSSACVERIFSQVNIVKTKQCNKLLCETVSNRILAKQAVKKGGICHTWNPCNSLLEDMREGRCRTRYEETLKLHLKQKTLNVDEIDVEDAVDLLP
jgi:hypothetical protein